MSRGLPVWLLLSDLYCVLMHVVTNKAPRGGSEEIAFPRIFTGKFPSKLPRKFPKKCYISKEIYTSRILPRKFPRKFPRKWTNFPGNLLGNILGKLPLRAFVKSGFKAFF